MLLIILYFIDFQDYERCYHQQMLKIQLFMVYLYLLIHLENIY